MELHPAGHQACSPGLSVGIGIFINNLEKALRAQVQQGQCWVLHLGHKKHPQAGERGAGKWKRPWSGGHQLEEHEPEG